MTTIGFMAIPTNDVLSIYPADAKRQTQRSLQAGTQPSRKIDKS
jgi:hypothetical protein